MEPVIEEAEVLPDLPDSRSGWFDEVASYGEREWAARMAFFEALSNFHMDPPQIKQDSQGHGYKYAGLPGNLPRIRASLAKHGLMVWWRRSRAPEGWLCLQCMLGHVGGYVLEGMAMPGPVDEGRRMNRLQGAGSAVTYLQRYTLYPTLGLASQEDDDGASAGPVPDQASSDKSGAGPPSVAEKGATPRSLEVLQKLAETQELKEAQRQYLSSKLAGRVTEAEAKELIKKAKAAIKKGAKTQ